VLRRFFVVAGVVSMIGVENEGRDDDDVVVVVVVVVMLIQQWSQRGFVTHWKYLVIIIYGQMVMLGYMEGYVGVGGV
jgi:hypothetical protein